jgi:hypothetical protein
MSPEDPPVPFAPDDETPAGDTPEVHDEISPHDLPKDNPGRERAVEESGGEHGTTRGNT